MTNTLLHEKSSKLLLEIMHCARNLQISHLLTNLHVLISKIDCRLLEDR